MSSQALSILRDYVGPPPEWTGDLKTEAQELNDWKQWSVRKRMADALENTLAARAAAAVEKMPRGKKSR